LLKEEVSEEIGEQLEIEGKYSIYIGKQEQSVARMRRLEDARLPENLDYEAISGLRKEARMKLVQFKPSTIGQASRLSGVNPADIAVLLVHLQRLNGRRQELELVTVEK
jgi:tRNA uridine 5-carboxymethylaminomethyl modification enzyme